LINLESPTAFCSPVRPQPDFAKTKSSTSVGSRSADQAAQAGRSDRFARAKRESRLISSETRQLKPQQRTRRQTVAAAEMGQSRHFALRKNREPFRRGTTRIFMTVWSSSGELQINQIDAAKARACHKPLLLAPKIVRRSAIRAAQPATRRRRTGQKTDRATSRCHW
jgi:hypothetical protein